MEQVHAELVRYATDLGAVRSQVQMGCNALTGTFNSFPCTREVVAIFAHLSSAQISGSASVVHGTTHIAQADPHGEEWHVERRIQRRTGVDQGA